MEQQQLPPVPKKRFTLPQVFGIVVFTVIIAIAVFLIVLKIYFTPRPFTPVVLNQSETVRLEKKLDQLEGGSRESSRQKKITLPQSTLSPEPYSEHDADRTIHFTERELNSLLATNTDLADKVAIDLAKDMVSLRLLIPLDPDLPVLGGKTLRIKAGMELAYRNNQPVIVFRGISLMGVPLPKAWLGGIKNMDLIQEFGSEDGFWKGFSEGVESLRVEEGELQIRLKN